MKQKILTAVGLIGVLSTGIASAAINTQVLQNRESSTIGESNLNYSQDTVTQEIGDLSTPAPTKTYKAKPRPSASSSILSDSGENMDNSDSYEYSDDAYETDDSGESDD